LEFSLKSFVSVGNYPEKKFSFANILMSWISHGQPKSTRGPNFEKFSCWDRLDFWLVEIAYTQKPFYLEKAKT
jgi:hypothetical protein